MIQQEYYHDDVLDTLPSPCPHLCRIHATSLTTAYLDLASPSSLSADVTYKASLQRVDRAERGIWTLEAVAALGRYGRFGGIKLRGNYCISDTYVSMSWGI